MAVPRSESRNFMPAFNKHFSLLDWFGSLRTGWFGYDAFAEMAAKACAEMSVGEDGYRFRPNVYIGKEGPPDTHPTSNFPAISEGVRPVKQVVLSFSHTQVFQHNVQVPASAINRIDDILKLEIERITPFSADQIFSGWFKQDKGNRFAHAGMLDIQHVVLRRDFASDVVSFLEGAGVKLKGIFVRGEDGQALPIAWAADGTKFGIAKLRFHRNILSLCAMIALMTGLSLTWAISSMNSMALAEIDQGIATISPDVDAVKSQIEKLKESSAALSALSVRKMETASVSETLLILTHLLPDGASLASITMSGSNLEIEGLALEPERLISDLEESSHFKNVAFSAPVTKNASEKASRFAIRAEFEAVRR
jgi:general secretion pathway protein L